MNKANVIALLLLVALLLQGCWDRIEIQERGFVIGIGIDLPPPEGEDEGAKASPRPLLGTFQIINPSVLQQGGGSASGGAKSGGTSRGYTNLTAQEHSLSSVSARIASMIGREPFFEHLSLLIVSSEAARDANAFSNAMDFLLRNPEMRRDITILIARAKASDILAVPPVNEHFPVQYLENILDNDRKSSYLLPEKRLGDLHENLLNDRSFVIQTVERGKVGVALTGAAVFDGADNTLQGFLNGPETQGLNLLMGTIDGGVLEAAHEGHPIDLLIDRISHSMHVDVSDPSKPVFRVTIKAEGALDQVPPGLNVNTATSTLLLKALFEEEITAVCMQTVKKLQQELKLDPAGFGQHLMSRHYRLWTREYEGKWDKLVFPNAEIRIEPTVAIRRLGNINESERS